MELNGCRHFLINSIYNYLTEHRKIWSNRKGLLVHVKNDVSKVMLEIPGVMCSYYGCE
jgi:hypothetical protein